MYSLLRAGRAFRPLVDYPDPAVEVVLAVGGAIGLLIRDDDGPSIGFHANFMNGVIAHMRRIGVTDVGNGWLSAVASCGEEKRDRNSKRFNVQFAAFHRHLLCTLP